MDKRMENKDWPLLKAVVKLVLNLLISSWKGYSSARKGRQKSNTGGNKHDGLSATSGSGSKVNILEKSHSINAMI